MARVGVGARIFSGFGLILILLALLAVQGYTSGTDFSSTLDTFSRVSGNSLKVAEIDRNVAGLRRNVIVYTNSADPKTLERIGELRRTLNAQITDVSNTTANVERRAKLTELGALLTTYGTTFDEAAANVERRERLTSAGINTIGPDARKKLASLTQSLMERDAHLAAAKVGQAQEALLLARLAAVRFLSAPSQDLLKESNERIGLFLQRAAELGTFLPSPTDIKAAREVQTLAEQYRTTFNELAEAAFATNTQVMVELPRVADEAGALTSLIKSEQAQRMGEIERQTGASISSTQKTSLTLSIFALVLGMAFALLIAMGITRPVRSMTSAMDALASGALQTMVPALDHRDEIGAMAKAVQVFKDNAIRVKALEAEQVEAERRAEEERKRLMNEMADNFENAVGGVVDSLSSQALEMESTAQSMSSIAEETSRQAAAVAAASEQASSNVQTVAAAADELSSSISEIGRQVQHSARIVEDAVNRARDTQTVVQGLSESANRIGDVINLITDIASQTNLLALNATIEAARAGDAGKGFAVVANEVKTLANQTARATDQISGQISAVQSETQQAVTAIKDIVSIIREVQEVASAIAGSVEEQNAATQEIARNVQEASAGTAEVSSNIQGVTTAASEAGSASSQVVASSKELAQNADVLKTAVTDFLGEVRAG
ncbi:MAG: HAMP domain-containing methyl-accepting chemotaxis protein [Rhodospirillaceae bacterium]